VGKMEKMMSEELKDTPVSEIIQVGSKTTTSDGTKIGSEEFIEKLKKLLNDKQAYWRSAKALAEKLGVDSVQLDKWLRKQTEIVSKPGKEEGVVYYALLSRIEKVPSKEEMKIRSMMSRPIVTEEDRYAVGILHMVYVNLHECLDKYALRISDRSMESFTNLIEARNRLEAGITLYTQTTKANVKKLPRL
jgi:hypothetical protein